MESLINVKKAVNEIAILLAQDDILCKLLINDSPDALEEPTPSKTLNDLITEKYICIYPPVESRIEDYGRNTFITILLDAVLFGQEDNNSRNTVALYVSTNEDHILLTKNRNRLLEMCDRILLIVQGRKISTAGEIHVTSLSHVMLSEFHSAYKVNIVFSDQSVRKAEI